MKLLLAVLANQPGLENEDPVGLGYLAALLKEYADISFAGFLTREKIIERMEQDIPDRILLGTFNGLNNDIKDCITHARSNGISVLLGGPGLSLPFKYNELLLHGVEEAIFGEADALCPRVLIGSRNPTFADGLWLFGQNVPKKPAVLVDPDSVPFPIRPSLEQGRTNSARMVTSRGCPLSCDYCFQPISAALTGIGWRPRTIVSIEKELDTLCRFGAQTISLTDDCTTPITKGRERLTEIANVFSGKHVAFSLMIAPQAISDVCANEIETWQKAGLKRMFLMLNAYSGLKGENFHPDVLVVNKRLCAAGIEVDVGWITIDPFVTPSIFLNRLRQLAVLEPMNPKAYVRPLSIVSGTEIESRYLLSRARFESGSLGTNAGVKFKYIHPQMPSLLENFLSFLDNASSITGADLSREVIQWVKIH